MDIFELKTRFPRLYQQVFSMGFDSGVKCQFNSARNDAARCKLQAAALIANSGGRHRAPVGFARVDSNNGASYVVPTF
jgi:hypothetical protein